MVGNRGTFSILGVSEFLRPEITSTECAMIVVWACMRKRRVVVPVVKFVVTLTPAKGTVYVCVS